MRGACIRRTARWRANRYAAHEARHSLSCDVAAGLLLRSARPSHHLAQVVDEARELQPFGAAGCPSTFRRLYRVHEVGQGDIRV